MTFDEFVEHMRQEIREEGFMPAIRLAARVVIRAKEAGMNDLGHKDYKKVMSDMVGGDIHTVEYTNTQAANHVVKILYYYNPNTIIVDSEQL